MRVVTATAIALATAILWAGCTGSHAPVAEAASCTPQLPAADPAWKAEDPRIRFDTDQGAFVAELYGEMAPITVDNFLNLTREGFYDGTLFHRVVHDFVIQGGDPLSKDSDPRNDGTGNPGYAIPDEFHPLLRHDGAGVLSMANSGPNTGGSQFFVTLNTSAHLDDRHSVFGRVISGNETVALIGSAQTDSDDRPLEPIHVVKLSEVDPIVFNATHAAGIHVVIADKKAEPGRAVRFAVILENQGNVRDALAIAVAPPAGWGCSADAPVVVPAMDARVAFVSLTPPTGASGTVAIPVQVNATSGASATTSVNVTIAPLGPQVKGGDKVTANYAGVLLDGRLFDTSNASVGKHPAQPKFVTINGWRDHPSYQPFPFTVGTGVIAGFSNLAQTAKVGETVTAIIPQKDAYAYQVNGPSIYERPLIGRDLVFELEILSVS